MATLPARDASDKLTAAFAAGPLWIRYRLLRQLTHLQSMSSDERLALGRLLATVVEHPEIRDSDSICRFFRDTADLVGTFDYHVTWEILDSVNLDDDA